MYARQRETWRMESCVPRVQNKERPPPRRVFLSNINVAGPLQLPHSPCVTIWMRHCIAAECFWCRYLLNSGQPR
jgi:hypothetical protein